MSEPETARDERFRNLFTQYAGQVRSYAARRVGRDAADEIVAETFLAVWNRLDDISDASLPWIYSLARGAVSHHRRATTRRSLLDARDARIDAPRTTPDIAVAVDTQSAIRDALKLLSERDREVLRLAVWEQLDPSATSIVLGCSVTSAKVRLHRARKRLRRLLDADEFAAGDPSSATTDVDPRSLRRAKTGANAVELSIVLDRPSLGKEIR